MLYYYRYIVFLLGVILCLFIAMPICFIRPYNAKNMAFYFKVFNCITAPLIGFKVHAEGLDILNQNRPAIVVGNHQHNFELLAVAKIFMTGNIVVLGKAELEKIPVFGLIYKLTGNIFVKRGHPTKAMESIRRLEENVRSKNISPLIFVEGHRNDKKDLLKFKKGAFITAVNLQLPLICFSCSQYAYHQDLKKFKKVIVYLKVHDPISTVGMTAENIPELMQKTRSLIEAGIQDMNKKVYS